MSDAANASDFDAWLGTPEAQPFEPWVLNNVLIIRRCIGKPFATGKYTRLANELVAALATCKPAPSGAEVRS